MKTIIISALILTSAVALSGCASSGGNGAKEPDLQQFVPHEGRYAPLKVLPGPPTEESVKSFGRLLTGKEIKEMLSGKLTKGITAYRQFGMNGFPWAQLYRADGTFECRSSGMNDQGTWWVEGDMMCLHFLFFHKDPKICTHVRVNDKGELTDYTDTKIMNYWEVVKQ